MKLQVLVFVFAFLVVSACTVQRRGGSDVDIPDGPKVKTLTPTNPKSSSPTEVTHVVQRKYTTAPWWTMASATGGQQKVEETVSTKGPASMLVEETVTDSVKTSVSGSWFSEMKAKLESLRWLQWLGVLGLVVAAAMFYTPIRVVVGAGKSMQLAIALGGLGLIFGPVLVVGNEILILCVVAAFVAWHYMTARLEYKSGQLDANKNGIPDDKE